MKAYHEIQPDTREAALANGLFRTSQGSKSDDPVIMRTDQFLDARRPSLLKKYGVSRKDNLYAYVHDDGLVVDITDGTHVPIGEFIAASTQQVLELDIDPQKCFVSDLDAYDSLKSALETHENKSALERLAEGYWAKIIKLSDCNPSTIRRPEIMITYDVPPDKIKAL